MLETTTSFRRAVPALAAAVLLAAAAESAAANFNAATPAEFQTALTTAQDNGESDTITVAAGTYELSSTLTYLSEQDFSLAIIGAGSATTILDGGNAIQPLSLTGNGGGDMSISGITFRNGRAPTDDNSLGGGFIIIQNGTGSVNIDSCAMTANTVYRSGGGAYISLIDGDATITNCQSTGNSCDTGTGVAGAGLYIYFDTIAAADNTVIIRNCTFSDNTIGDHPNAVGGCYGAGLMVYHVGPESDPTYIIEGNTISDNSSHFGTGGAFIKNSGHNTVITISENVFSGNISGGGIEDPLPEIIGSGLHLYTSGGTITVSGNQFIGNSLLGEYEDGAGLGCLNIYEGTFRMEGNVFADNSCAIRNGGGAYINLYSGVTEAIIAGNLFVNNQAGAESGSGGGLSLNSECDVTLVNNTFHGNSASAGGGMTYYAAAAADQASLVNEIYRGNTPDSIAVFDIGPVQATYSNIQGGTGESYFGTGCIDADPLFSAAGNPAGPDGVYATADDGLHLTAGSPSANTGSSAALPAWLTEDIAGAGRPQGGAVDMGCYEGTAGAGTALSVSLSPSTINEDGGTSTATVTRPGDTADALLVNIASSDITIAAVPATVTILAGSATATFTVTAVDNPGATGDRTATIGVSAADLEDGSAVITVTDNESLSVTIVPGSISEAETATGTVSIPAVRETDLAVALSSSNTAAATVPAEVTIAAGALSAAFTVTAVDDASAAGDRLVTITATAEGFANGSASVTVTDDDEAGFTVAVGSVYQVSVGDLGDDAEGNPYQGENFTRKPKITADYYDPVKDPGNLRLKRAAAKVSTDPPPVESVSCEWKKKICLYDKKAILKSQTAEEYIPEVQVDNLEMDQWVSVSDDDGNSGPFACGTVTLMPPSITGVFSDAEFSVPIVSAAAGATIYIEGRYFGAKPPKVWLEYPVEKSSGTQVKAKKCKVLKPLEYVDAKGKTSKSCMDLTAADGQSRIRVQLPPKFPRGWTAGPHNIVIDNKVGRATIEFETE